MERTQISMVNPMNLSVTLTMSMHGQFISSAHRLSEKNICMRGLIKIAQRVHEIWSGLKIQG